MGLTNIACPNTCRQPVDIIVGDRNHFFSVVERYGRSQLGRKFLPGRLSCPPSCSPELLARRSSPCLCLAFQSSGGRGSPEIGQIPSRTPDQPPRTVTDSIGGIADDFHADLITRLAINNRLFYRNPPASTSWSAWRQQPKTAPNSNALSLSPPPQSSAPQPPWRNIGSVALPHREANGF